MLWSIWAETVAEELSDIVDAPPPLLDSAPLYIHILTDSKTANLPVVPLQAYPDGKLLQRLLLYRTRRSQSEALAGLCELLCNRYAIARQPSAKRADDLAAFPDWLSIGLSLNLPSANRGHYRTLAAAVWRRGDMPSAKAILGMGQISGRTDPEQEAAFFALADWLISNDNIKAVFRSAAEASALGRDFTLPDLLAVCPNIANKYELEQARDLALARIDWGGELARRAAPLDALARLEKLLGDLPAQYSILASESLEMGVLPDYRAAYWMDELCMRAIARLREFSMTVDRDLRSTIELYIKIFRMLSLPDGNIFQRLWNQTASDRKIERMIADADEKLQAVGKRYQDYNSYLDKVENNLYNNHGSWRYMPTQAEIDYIDKFEEKYLLP